MTNQYFLVIPAELSDWGLLVIAQWLEDKAAELARQQDLFYETVEKAKYDEELNAYTMVIKLVEKSYE